MKPEKFKSGKAKVAFEVDDSSQSRLAATESKQDPQFDMFVFMSGIEEGLAPVVSRLNALEAHAKESSGSSYGSALSAKSPSPSKSVLEILAEIQDSQAKQAASQAELQNRVATQQDFLRYRFEDFPSK